jgi:hypothetical protein
MAVNNNNNIEKVDKTKHSLQKEANLIKQKYDTRNDLPKYQDPWY